MRKIKKKMCARLLIIAVCAGGVVLFIARGAHDDGILPSAEMTWFNRLRYVELPTAATQQEPATSSPATAIPIVVYHIVRPSYPSDSASVRAIALTPETFDAELSHLQGAGYRIIGFPALEDYFASSTPLPAKPMIISFDDGWYDQYEYAFPILRKHGMTAAFFIFTNAVGHRGFVTWDELRSLVSAGMTVSSHSRSHPYLPKITDQRKLWDEIDGSKKILEKELGAPVEEFAYPFGQYDRAIVALVKKAGYHSARGDYWSGNRQSAQMLYTLSALNAPTTTEAFARRFP